MRRERIAVTALLVSMQGWGGAPPVQAVVFTRQKALQVRAWEITRDQGVAGIGASGASTAVAPSLLLSLSPHNTVDCVSSGPQVRLRNGEVIAASITAGRPNGRFAFESPSWGSFEIAQEAIAEYAAHPVGLRGSRPAAPYVVLRNGDALTAAVEGIDPKGLTIISEFGATRIPFETVGSIVFSADVPAVDGRHGERFLVELTDGQRVYCDAIVQQDRDTVRLDRRGVQFTAAQRWIRRILWPGATMQYVSAVKLDTAGKGYFGQSIQPTRDCNRLGQPLRLEQRRYARGIATRPSSTVSLARDATWRYLEGTVGLDPWLGRDGSCRVSVLLDGRVVVDAALEGTEARVPLAVPLENARHIRLKTAFGPRGDLGDDVNWCDLTLIGSRRVSDR